MFEEVGRKFLDPTFQAAVKTTKEERKEGTKAGGDSIKLKNEEPNTDNKDIKKKKKCC